MISPFSRMNSSMSGFVPNMGTRERMNIFAPPMNSGMESLQEMPTAGPSMGAPTMGNQSAGVQPSSGQGGWGLLSKFYNGMFGGGNRLPMPGSPPITNNNEMTNKIGNIFSGGFGGGMARSHVMPQQNSSSMINIPNIFGQGGWGNDAAMRANMGYNMDPNRPNQSQPTIDTPLPSFTKSMGSKARQVSGGY